MNQLAVFLLLPGWDASSGLPPAVCRRHPFIHGSKRDNAEQRVLSKEATRLSYRETEFGSKNRSSKTPRETTFGSKNCGEFRKIEGSNNRDSTVYIYRSLKFRGAHI